ncbi:MAG: glycine zipper 2TM domain-containing protein [Hyphomonadaceae bacterium]
MKNAGWLAAGIAGAAVLTAGVGFALNNSNSSVPLESAEVRVAAAPGMTQAEMEARIAEERAAAEARAQAKINCERERQEASNRGAVVGGAAGAVIGSNVAGNGAKSEGGVLGALAGATVGRDIAKKDHRC